MRYQVLYKLAPPGFFGLPDGIRTVVPLTASGSREITSPILDVRSGVLVSHGTLSEYRREQDAVKIDQTVDGVRIEVHDNFLSIFLEDPSPDGALSTATATVDVICQALSAQFGVRFSAELQSIQDPDGALQRVRRARQLQITNAVTYNTSELKSRIERAFSWAMSIDDRGRKALLYFEHGCLLAEFAQTLPLSSPHASFSWAIAFLQLYKSLVVIIGEPGTDRDYQTRARRLGLPADFWSARVKNLYDVRNDEDVAHYTLRMPEPGMMTARFGQASAVFKEAFDAHMSSLAKSKQ